MDEKSEAEPDAAETVGAGAQLRAARRAAGLELSQVAEQTRIPQRHLLSIEGGVFSALPSSTYAVGFSRTYARMLGLDENAIVAKVREELAEDEYRPANASARFEPGDPAHVPSRRLAWFAAFAAILLLIGGYSYYRTRIVCGTCEGPIQLVEDKADAAATANNPPAAAPAAPAVPSGPVVFTSLMDGTWVRFYDGSGKTLFDGLMDKGDSYTVPGDAQDPQIWTGRPYAFTITIGGKPVPKLSEEDEIVRDIGVTAKALLARPAPSPAAAPAASGRILPDRTPN